VILGVRGVIGPSSSPTPEIMNLTTSEITKLGIALAICYGAYRFIPNTAAKTAALGIAGTIVAKQIPYLSDALA